MKGLRAAATIPFRVVPSAIISQEIWTGRESMRPVAIERERESEREREPSGIRKINRTKTIRRA